MKTNASYHNKVSAKKVSAKRRPGRPTISQHQQNTIREGRFLTLTAYERRTGRLTNRTIGRLAGCTELTAWKYGPDLASPGRWDREYYADSRNGNVSGYGRRKISA